MDSLRHRPSPGSERFLGPSSPPSACASLAADGLSGEDAGDELHEDDLFWDPAEHLDSPHPAPSIPSPDTDSSPNPTAGFAAAFRRPDDRSFGILAALPEDDRLPSLSGGAPPLLQRKPSLSSPSSASASTAPSSSTAARMIPAIPKPRLEYSLSLPTGRGHHPSAPVDVPVPAGRARRRGSDEIEEDGRHGRGDGDEDEMLPPHEMVARTHGRRSPMTTFSVLEGAGRTLKGRDLRRVRNAVWRRTGFLD